MANSPYEITELYRLCLRVTSGGTPSRSVPEYFEGGTIPWMKTGEVKQRFVYSTEEHITELGLENSSAKLIPANSLVVAMYGDGDTAGNVAINKVPVTTNQACCNFVVDPTKADYRFLYYYLKANYANLVNLKLGGSQQNLNAATLKRLPVPVISLALQRKIAAILSAYDDLIANNQRRIALLEGMAEEIYREWFVRMRFPGASTAAMNKGRPVDWSREKLDALLVESKRPLKTADLSTVQRYVGLEHIPRKRVVLDAWGLPESVDSDKLRFEAGEILFGKIRPYLHKVSIAPFSGACSTDTIVLKPRQQASKLFAYFTVFSDTFVDLATASSNGTKMPRANWNFLKSVEVTVPPDNLMNSFNIAAKPMIEQVMALLSVNERLAQSRDALLPRLISGKLKVNHLDIRLPPSMRAEAEAVA